MTQAAQNLYRVLVVDDEPDLRELLTDALAGRFEVVPAASGSEAVDRALQTRPDLIVTDLCLGDGTGLDVIDRVRGALGEIPTIVITGVGDPRALAEVSTRRPIELMTKPLNVEHLVETIRLELGKPSAVQRLTRRNQQLRSLLRSFDTRRKEAQHRLDDACSEMAASYRQLSTQMSLQEAVIAFQRDLVSADNDDQVFCSLFRTFVRRTGSVFGAALICDANAQLQIAGRFGVPNPDGAAFCQAIAAPVIDRMLGTPRVMTLDAEDEIDSFAPSIRRYLVGVSILAIPLLPCEGEMIGLVVLYRKGEQPFTDSDVALAEMIAPSTAAAIRRND